MMTLTRYGLREWMTITIICLLIAIPSAYFELWWAVGAAAVFWIALAGFFRDPWRKVPMDLPAGTMLSPADGTISKIFRLEHHESTGGPAVVVRIFLSVLNVHLNRSPYDGEIVAIVHTPGKYHDARTELSAKENESNLMTLKIESGETIGIRQVSGAIARRIVCPVKAGQKLIRGERYGMIKFGSTTELILPRPDDVEVLVAEGDKVKGGLTLLARLGEKS